MKEIHTNIEESTLEAKNEYRHRIDLLRTRVHLLTGRDRLLMTMYLERGNSIRQIARVAGVADTVIARRIRKLTKRLLDGEYIMCLRNQSKFTRTEMAIARDYFLLGLSIKKTALKHRLTYYRARETVRRIRHLIAATQQQYPLGHNNTAALVSHRQKSDEGK
jgi:predicted DNA-binding protein YlxM (UPF0122 family)